MYRLSVCYFLSYCHYFYLSVFLSVCLSRSCWPLLCCSGQFVLVLTLSNLIFLDYECAEPEAGSVVNIRGLD